MHHRLRPKRHRFRYRIFMWWLDLEELDMLKKRFPFFSRNRFNMFSFYDRDHFKYPAGDPRNDRPVRVRLDAYCAEQNIPLPDKVYLLTHCRVLGYIFNPVSFYFCFRGGECAYVITETSNTFGEMKMFLVDKRQESVFIQDAVKYFYVSPFTELEQEFAFRYRIPDTQLDIRIDVRDAHDGRFFISTLRGRRKEMRSARLWYYFFRFPLITVQVISAIHWQAFLLWIKKVPFHRKRDHPELQKDITNS